MAKISLIFVAFAMFGLVFGIIAGTIGQAKYIEDHTQKCENTLKECVISLENCVFQLNGAVDILNITMGGNYG